MKHALSPPTETNGHPDDSQRPPKQSVQQSPNAPDEILTVGELAALLKKHPETLRRLWRKGDLPGAKIGRDLRFSKRAIMAHLSQPRENERAPQPRDTSTQTPDAQTRHAGGGNVCAFLERVRDSARAKRARRRSGGAE